MNITGQPRNGRTLGWWRGWRSRPAAQAWLFAAMLMTSVIWSESAESTPKASARSMEVLVSFGRDGKVTGVDVLKTSGSSRRDRRTPDLIKKTWDFSDHIRRKGYGRGQVKVPIQFDPAESGSGSAK